MSNAECERGAKCLIASYFFSSLHGLLVTVISLRRDKQFCFALLPSFTQIVGQAFHSFKECCRLQVTITPNKSCFLLFPHYAAWSGDRPFNTAL